ncbi:hypothetical protein BJY16_006516 [Actinoplanes octamycinicus]|uniref:Uncharacterized protein n=1 Tax=Actinoplanes octamycinicus TaxID=135948 RepID=A0A7W7MAJ3_9ACTN|nr:hypothetical protein [Actinoplanes octamycinicus]
MAYQVGELLAQAAGGDALERVDQPSDSRLGWEVDQQVHVIVLAVELDQLCLEVGADVAHDRLHPNLVLVGEHLVSELRHENQVDVHRKDTVSAVRIP